MSNEKKISLKKMFEKRKTPPSPPFSINREQIIQKMIEHNLDILGEMNQHLHLNKGIERLKTWKCLFNYPPFYYHPNFENFQHHHMNDAKKNQFLSQTFINKMYSNKKRFFFIFAGLIITFQVFGDANHRTAHIFYHENTNDFINETQMNKIILLHSSLNDYQNVFFDKKYVTKIINHLMDIYDETSFYPSHRG